MSESQTTNTTTKDAAPKGSIADTIFDLGLTWADMGIGLGKVALENTASALQNTAKCLGAFQERLKGAAAAPPAHEDSAGGAPVAVNGGAAHA